jgi:hypothetical protein
VPENLIGYLPEGAKLPLRELNDGTFAYSSEGRSTEEIAALPGFVRNTRKGTKKTWAKTSWKKKGK